MENIGPASIVGIFAGLVAGAAIHPIVGLIVGIAVTIGYAMLIGDSGMPYEDDGGADSGSTVQLWEYAPGKFSHSSNTASGGAARYIVLTDPTGSFTDAYEMDGSHIARLRRTGTSEWESM